MYAYEDQAREDVGEAGGVDEGADGVENASKDEEEEALFAEEAVERVPHCHRAPAHDEVCSRERKKKKNILVRTKRINLVFRVEDVVAVV